MTEPIEPASQDDIEVARRVNRSMQLKELGEKMKLIDYFGKTLVGIMAGLTLAFTINIMSTVGDLVTDSKVSSSERQQFRAELDKLNSKAEQIVGIAAKVDALQQQQSRYESQQDQLFRELTSIKSAINTRNIDHQ